MNLGEGFRFVPLSLSDDHWLTVVLDSSYHFAQVRVADMAKRPCGLITTLQYLNGPVVLDWHPAKLKEGKPCSASVPVGSRTEVNDQTKRLLTYLNRVWRIKSEFQDKSSVTDRREAMLSIGSITTTLQKERYIVFQALVWRRLVKRGSDAEHGCLTL